MRIEVTGAPTEELAAALGRAAADSVLWRCAVNGADPNWGRVLSALGTVDRELDLTQVTLSIGEQKVYEKGEPVAAQAEAAAVMAADEFTVTCAVGSGPGRAAVLSADTSAEYVLLNAEGSS